MFRMLVILATVCLLNLFINGQEIDLAICPGGLTTAPSDPRWPTTIPNRFEFVSEISTDVETFEMKQLFLGPYRDVIHFHDHDLDLRTYYDFETNEVLIINRELKCERTAIQPNEYLSFIASQIVKPSVLFGFDGRNNVNNAFYTRYIGRATIRDGITTKVFQSCFYLAEEKLTINATYYLSEPRPQSKTVNSATDFVQVDILSNNYPYTYNIVRFVPNPSLTINTPTGVYCPNRTNTKKLPENLPSHLSFHAEAYSLKTSNTNGRIESLDRLLDEKLQFERTDYILGKVITPPPPSTAFIDYATNLSYLYTRDTQQCAVMNITRPSMESTSEILFQIGANDDSTGLQYTGITDCGRENVQCHRWIIERDLNTIVQQYEWYWSARYNQLDLQDSIPIKMNVKTMYKGDSTKVINQEINLFNYNPSPNTMQAIDATLGKCYRALGPSNGFNYAVLRLTLDNDAGHPVHRHLLSLENRLHMQLASDLKVRHLRFSSFVIDTTRDTTDQEDHNVHVTFTLLENPPTSTNTSQEPSSLALIRQLVMQIDDGKFHVRDEQGAYQLQARPFSLRILAPYLLPIRNQTNIVDEVIKHQQKIVKRNTGPMITAMWTGFALLGVVVAFAIGSFIAIRKWTPTVNN